MGVRLCILIVAMIFTTLFGLFGCDGGAKKTVASVEAMTLTLRTMRGGVVYTLEGEGDTTQLRRYRETYRGGEDELMLESSVPCGVQTMIELMNTCGILRWDGFYGKHPRGVKDGTMFTFTATVNGGQTIRAEGSANFPKGYHELVQALNEMLANTETT